MSAETDPEFIPTRRTNRWILPAVAIVLVAAAAVAAVLIWSSRPGQQTFVIPAGTQMRIDRGEYLDLFPESVHAETGDTLIIDNQDDVPHTFGPYVARANERLVVKLAQGGEFPGPCSVNDSGSTVIHVG